MSQAFGPSISTPAMANSRSRRLRKRAGRAESASNDAVRFIGRSMARTRSPVFAPPRLTGVGAVPPGTSLITEPLLFCHMPLPIILHDAGRFRWAVVARRHQYVRGDAPPPPRAVVSRV